MNSRSYLLGIKIGSAQESYRILERILKKYFRGDFKKYKYKLRKLAEIETEELLMEIMESKDIKTIKKYIG